MIKVHTCPDALLTILLFDGVFLIQGYENVFLFVFFLFIYFIIYLFVLVVCLFAMFRQLKVGLLLIVDDILLMRT